MWRVEDGLDAQPRGVIEHHRGKKATLIVRGADSDDQTTYEFETNRA